MNSTQRANLFSGHGTSSPFFKRHYRRSLAFVGTSGLLVGVGFAGSSPALSNGVLNCDGKTIYSADHDPGEEQRQAIESFLQNSDLVCLSGDFVLDQGINVNGGDYISNVTFYGLENSSSSIKSLGSWVFFSIYPAAEGPELTIDNLTIKESDNPVQGYNVYIKDSTFSNNTGVSVNAQQGVEISDSTFTHNIGNSTIATGGNVEVFNSTFRENSSPDNNGGAIRAGGSVNVSGSNFESNTSTDHLGGAVFASQEVDISDSTFTGNSSYVGGAIFAGYDGSQTAVVTNCTFKGNSSFFGGAVTAYGVEILNSTFLGNEALGPDASGGAVYSNQGSVFFSTFVNNVSEDVAVEYSPGNDIFKDSDFDFHLGGNIFASSSNNQNSQLGKYNSTSSFTDQGGNVFTTSSELETGIVRDPSSVFDKTLLSIFGSSTPSLSSFAPNSDGPKTLALVVGSPALNAVPNRSPFNTVTVDQRGATRSFPASAGAFEGVAPVSPTPSPTTAPAALAKTGSESPYLASIVASSLIAVGGLITAATARLRRRTK